MSGSTMKISAVCMVALMAFLIVPQKGTEAQIPPCAAKLATCASFLNATKPPSSCCGPLKDALTNDFVCLCNLFNTPGLLTSFGINVSEIVTLPARCKIHGADISACSKVHAPASSPAPTPASSPSNLPPSTPGAAKGEGNSLKGTWIGAICSMILFLISVMLN
ncbi:non-specific lipid transfer protein GPI-anchored 7-like [Impatiens glandulifera]|uniref:non-specific lipid transfer protein GPI-anchored 7-like n=1 Tax=Impatiens glandulifera TaxID=253017 RepID=UPI001FB11235|nr:non-specific lipid transfer protein GPI-anchored 7-like [Impatiens glandulifera]